LPPQRALSSAQNAAVESRSSEEKRDYDLAYIEFDRTGRLLVFAISSAAAVDLVKQVPQEKKPLLVLYVHRWQNNASDASSDVPPVSPRTLEKLARTRSVARLPGRGRFILAGAGSRLTIRSAKIISFKNPQRRCDANGRSNTITEAIFRVVYEARP
jgi:hypothetical protein